MRSEGGGGDSYLVVADSLVRAARDVRVVADAVREGVLLGLDDSVDVGHQQLQAALADFASRWQTGAEELIHRQHSIADRLTSVVASYLDQEATSMAAYRAADGSRGSGEGSG